MWSSTQVVKAWKERLKEIIATFMVHSVSVVKVSVSAGESKSSVTLDPVNLLDKDPRTVLVDLLESVSKSVDRAGTAP